MRGVIFSSDAELANPNFLFNFLSRFGKGSDHLLKEDHVPEIKKSPAPSPYLGPTSPSLKARRTSVQIETTDAIYLPTTL